MDQKPDTLLGIPNAEVRRAKEEAEEGAQPPETGYEFKDKENVVILQTGKRSRLWGMLALLWGLVILATGALTVVWLEAGPGAVVVGAIFGVSAIVPLLIGLSFLRAGRSFMGVAETEGLDIPYLMRALESLASALRSQIVMGVLGFVLFLLALAAALVFPVL